MTRTATLLLCIAAAARAAAPTCLPEPLRGVAEFPAEAAIVHQWVGYDASKPLAGQSVRRPQPDAIRRHAWRLVAAATRSSQCDPGIPVFRTWTDKKATFSCSQVRPFVPLLNALTKPSEIPDGYRSAAASNTSAMSISQSDIVADSLFNETARNRICDAWEPVNRPDHLRSLLSAGKKVVFPAGSVIARPFFVRVPDNSCIQLPVWNERPGRQGTLINPVQSWPDSVLVKVGTPTAGSPCRNGQQVFSPADFYTVSDAEGLKLLVGMHIAAREKEHWTFLTLWWHALADHPLAAGRPPDLSRPWHRYVMQVAMDADAPWRDGMPHVAFNPYVEAALPGGVQSNCISCHSRASHPDNDDGVTPIGLETSLLRHQQVTRGWDASRHTWFSQANRVLLVDRVWAVALNGEHATPVAAAGRKDCK